MVEPKQSELDAFVTLGDVMKWVGVAQDSESEKILLSGLGAGREDSYRPIGQMAKADYEVVAEALRKAGDVVPSPFMLSSWKAVGRVCRLASGAEPGIPHTPKSL